MKNDIGLRRVSARAFFFKRRRRHTRFDCDWSSDVCSSDLGLQGGLGGWHVLGQEDAFGGGAFLELAPDLQDLTAIGFEHDDVAGDLGFELVEHGDGLRFCGAMCPPFYPKCNSPRRSEEHTSELQS